MPIAAVPDATVKELDGARGAVVGHAAESTCIRCGCRACSRTRKSSSAIPARCSPFEMTPSTAAATCRVCWARYGPWEASRPDHRHRRSSRHRLTQRWSGTAHEKVLDRGCGGGRSCCRRHRWRPAFCAFTSEPDRSADREPARRSCGCPAGRLAVCPGRPHQRLPDAQVSVVDAEVANEARKATVERVDIAVTGLESDRRPRSGQCRTVGRHSLHHLESTERAARLPDKSRAR